MTKFVLISGKRFSGKDTVAKILRNIIKNNCLIISFAEVVKFEVAKNLNLNYDRLIVDREYKEKYRHELVKYADERKSYEDINIFVKSLINQVSYFNPSWCIIPDCRFKHEIEYFKDNKLEFTTMRISVSDEIRRIRGWIKSSIDESLHETELDNYINFDYYINNDNNIEYLKQILSLIVYGNKFFYEYLT